MKLTIIEKTDISGCNLGELVNQKRKQMSYHDELDADCDEQNFHFHFNFKEETYNQLQSFMIQHPGHTTEELVDLINFYPFTEESLKIAFDRFNYHKSTFHGICGPFVCKEGRWFPIYDKQNTESVVLAQENSTLRNKIVELESNVDEIIV